MESGLCSKCKGQKVVVNLMGASLHETCPACRGTGKAAVVQRQFVGWPLKVRLGQWRSGGEVRAALKKAGTEFSPCAGELIDRMPLVPGNWAREVMLAVIEGSELGFSERHTTGELIQKLRAHADYDVCPPECGPLVHLVNMPERRSFKVAMETVKDRTGDQGIFGRFRPWLEAYYEVLGGPWCPSEHWIVIRRKH